MTQPGHWGEQILKIFELLNDDGQIFAFEYNSTLTSMNDLKGIIESIKGVSDLQLRKSFGTSPDVVASFKLQDNAFLVWEPHGDSSRFWVGPDEEKQDLDITDIRRAFESYEPSLIRKVIGVIS